MVTGCEAHADGRLDPELVALVEAAVKEEVAIVGELSEVASKHPYYKYAHHSRLTSHSDRT